MSKKFESLTTRVTATLPSDVVSTLGRMKANALMPQQAVIEALIRVADGKPQVRRTGIDEARLLRRMEDRAPRYRLPPRLPQSLS